MSNIRNWSTTPASNNSAPPNGAPEGMAPSTVNDIMRQQMADHKTQWQDAEWFDWGDTPSRASATSFKVTGDVTTRYLVGRRLKCYDAATVYATITASSYSAPDTTITVSNDSSSLTASLTSVALAILSPANSSLPTFTNIAASGTASISGAAVFKTSLTVEGAATISGAAVFKTTATVEGSATISGTAVMKTTAIVEGALLEVKGNATNAGYIRQYEDTDNGTNYIEHRAPASIAANRTINWPDTDISGFIVQRVSTISGAVATGSTTIPDDDTVPQNTEGDEYLTRSITPKSSSNILVFDIWLQATNSSDTPIIAALFQDTTANALAATYQDIGGADRKISLSFRYVMTAGTTSATTFKVRAGGASAGTTTINGSGGGRKLGGVISSGISITEISV